MYPNKEDDYISLDDALKHFPKWADAWKNNGNDKYNYLYAGFGNGLSIDKSVYSEYEPYLNKHVENYLSDKEDKESLKYAAILNVWIDALNEMNENKKKNYY